MTTRLPPLRHLGFVAVGGAMGAVARVAFATWFPTDPGRLPWVTLAENVGGAFLLAVVITVLTERLALGPAVRLLVGTGALGAFTSYSTLAVEVDRLVVDGAVAVAGTYVLLSLVAGLGAAIAGVRVGQRRPSAARRAARADRRSQRRRRGGGARDEGLR